MIHIHRSTATLLAALFTLYATTNATAQTRVVPPSEAQGLFSGWASGIGVHHTANNTVDPVLIHAPAIANGVPSPWTAASFSAATADHPDYSMPVLTQSWNPPVTAEPRMFGDISTGNDLMPYVDAWGRLDMSTQQRWFAMTVTVDNAAQGQPGSMVELQRAGTPPRNPAADIISYYAVGSGRINPELVDTVRLESSREQLQLQSTDEIVSLDYALGGISANPSTTFPIRRSFYFTLTQAWINSLALNNSGWTIAGALPNASTVYAMKWNASTLTWSAPVVAFSHAELFANYPTVQPGTVEIDGLSVDEGENGPTQARAVVFSLTPPSDMVFPGSPAGSPIFIPPYSTGGGGWDQLLVYQRTIPLWNTACPTTPLMTQMSPGPSATVTSHLGFIARSGPTGAPTNATATCGLDPRLDAYAVQSAVGLATDQLSQGEGHLGLSVFRTCHGHPDGSSGDVVTLQVTGLSFASWHDATWQAGAIQMYVESAADQPPFTSWAVGDPIWIDPTTLQRNTIDLPLSLPHPGTSLTPLRMSAHLFGYTPATGWVSVRQSWVTTIGI